MDNSVTWRHLCWGFGITAAVTGLWALWTAREGEAYVNLIGFDVPVTPEEDADENRTQAGRAKV